MIVKLKLSIWQKIIGSFSILIFIMIENAVVNIVTLDKNNEVIRKNAQIISPSADELNKFLLMVTRSRMLITNWVFIPPQTGHLIEDKKELKNIHRREYNQLKNRLDSLSQRWDDAESVRLLDSIFSNYETLQGLENEIMQGLASFEDYDDNQHKFLIEEKVEDGIIPLSAKIQLQLKKLIKIKEQQSVEYQTQILDSFENLIWVTVVVSLISIVVGISFALIMAKSLTDPIKYIRNIITALSRGEIPKEEENASIFIQEDEIGEMKTAVDRLIQSFRSTSEFADAIGKGQYNAVFDPLGDNDMLGNSLISMRDNLKNSADEGKERRWTNEGLSVVNELLKTGKEEFEKLADEIIKLLVLYLNANQGALFIINTADKSGEYMDLTACYAWNKKKFLNDRVNKGDGLTGQAWAEKNYIYLKEVPEDYIQLTSGLGKALPRTVLIVPMVLNNVVFGVIELASLHTFEQYQIDFLVKTGENIASTLSILKSSEETKNLLRESQQITHQLASQEEEMRQNLEELQATQEEMERVQRELRNRNALVEQSLFLLETDTRKNLLTATERTFNLLKFSKQELIGFSIFNIVENEIPLNAGYRVMENGSIWSDEIELRTKGGALIWVQISGTPISRPNGSVEKYVFIFSDISHVKNQERLVVEKNEELIRVRKAEQERVNNMISSHKSVIERLNSEISVLREKVGQS
jgi:PAS domain S-box-containing protein